MSASNEVESIQGLDALQQRLAEISANDPMGLVKSLVTEDYFKQLMDAGNNLPGHPVPPGDSWPVTLNIALGSMGEVFVDRPVIGIHALDLVWGLGTLHCLTQQQPSATAG